jgi:hypothetical protein
MQERSGSVAFEHMKAARGLQSGVVPSGSAAPSCANLDPIGIRCKPQNIASIIIF